MSDNIKNFEFQEQNNRKSIHSVEAAKSGKAVSSEVSRNCWARAGESWCAPRLCVSQIQTQLLWRRGRSSKQAHQLISPRPPSSPHPTLHFATFPSPPSSTNTHLLFAQWARLLIHFQISTREEHTKYFSTVIVWTSKIPGLRGIPALPCCVPLASGLAD